MRRNIKLTISFDLSPEDVEDDSGLNAQMIKNQLIYSMQDDGIKNIDVSIDEEYDE